MIGKLTDKLTGYFQARIDVLKLSLIERTSLVMGFVLFMIAGMMMLTAIMIFLGIGLAMFLGEQMESMAGGYFATAGIYILLLVIMVATKKQLLKWMAGLFINMLTGGEDDDDDEDDDARQVVEKRVQP